MIGDEGSSKLRRLGEAIFSEGLKDDSDLTRGTCFCQSMLVRLVVVPIVKLFLNAFFADFADSAMLPILGDDKPDLPSSSSTALRRLRVEASVSSSSTTRGTGTSPSTWLSFLILRISMTFSPAYVPRHR